MSFSHSLASRIRDSLPRRRNIEEKKMFGGVCFLLNGNILIGVWKTSLIVRVGPNEYDDALREPHVREFDVTGRAMKGWVMVEADGVDHDGQLLNWIHRAMTFVNELPAK